LIITYSANILDEITNQKEKRVYVDKRRTLLLTSMNFDSIKVGRRPRNIALPSQSLTKKLDRYVCKANTKQQGRHRTNDEY